MTRREVLVAFIIASTANAVAPTVIRAEGNVANAAIWMSVIQAMFPQHNVDATLYGLPAAALVAAAAKDPATQQILRNGWQSLNTAAGNDWAHADEKTRTRALQSIATTPLFSVLRQITVFTFYNDMAVWAACGYEGDAWRFGGYGGAHLITIDWLPATAS